MNTLQPKPETTVVVILGASQFPKIKSFDPNLAFKTSAKAFHDYFLSRTGFGLPPENLLDLFDTHKSPSDVDEEIANFLEKRSKELKVSGESLRDVVVYYVGHGGFTDDGGPTEYFLTLFNTREQQKRISGYLIQALATTLKKFATHQRKYLILDCCFAAAAYKSFQSAPLQVAVKQTLDNFEYAPKGVVLLCAASKVEPALTLPDHEYTMFSTALLQILREGDKDSSDKFSFQQLGELIYTQIKMIFQDEAVRPEVHSPDQKKGDVARIPFFPNLYKNATLEEYVALGIKAMLRGDYGEARRYFAMVLDIDPYYPRARELLEEAEKLYDKKPLLAAEHQQPELSFSSDIQTKPVEGWVEFAERCWDEAREILYDRTLEKWLAYIDLEELASKAKYIRQAEQNQSLGLELFLRATGLVKSQTKRNAKTNLEEIIGQLNYWTLRKQKSQRIFELKITNIGRGYLHGMVKSNVNWLELNRTDFGCLRDQSEILQVDFIPEKFNFWRPTIKKPLDISIE